MEDLEDSGSLNIGSGVIVYAEDDKRYVGFLQGFGDNYMYLKATHEWGSISAEVTPDSKVRLREMLDARPMWKLRVAFAWRYRAVPRLSREETIEAVAEWMEDEAIESVGQRHTFIAKPKAVNMAIPHMSIEKFESLQDVMSGTILEGLDFGVEEEYNQSDDTNGTGTE